MDHNEIRPFWRAKLQEKYRRFNEDLKIRGFEGAKTRRFEDFGLIGRE
jgi:hypothetical protein